MPWMKDFSPLVTFWRTVGHIVWFVAALALGLLLTSTSFDQLQKLRQLQRLPMTEPGAVIEGETKTHGKVRTDPDRGLTTSMKVGVPSVYWRYLKERQEGSGDNKRWVTLTDRTESVPFYLQDGPGQIRIENIREAKIIAKERFYDRSGDIRETEWRIEPDEELHIIGYAEDSGDGELAIYFDTSGEYTPLVTYKTEFSQRRSFGFWSIFACWGGMLLLAQSVVALCSLFKVHEIFYYQVFAGFALILALVISGIAMMARDLSAGHDHCVRHEAAAKEAIALELSAAGIAWEGDWEALRDFSDPAQYPLNDDVRERRLRRVRVDSARLINRFNGQRSAFPEFIFAPAWGIASVDKIPLPQNDVSFLQELEEAYKPTQIRGIGSFVWVIIAAAVSYLMTWWGMRLLKVKRYIENLPTTQAKGVVYGLTEVAGKIEMPKGVRSLTGPLTSGDCAWFLYTIHELRKSGKNSSWVEIYRSERHNNFYCRDRSGTVLVDPEGAEFITKETYTRKKGKKKYAEKSLFVGDDLYALGTAVIDPETHDRLIVSKDPQGEAPFILSSKSEDDVMFSKARLGMFVLALATGMVVFFALLLFGSMGSFAPTDYLASALIAISYLGILYLAFIYNDLVFLKNRAERDWSNIDVAMKKRADLIPRLVEVVKGYFAHESEVMEKVISMRNKYSGGAFISPVALMDYLQAEESFLNAFMGLKEKYPNLRGSELAGQLMEALIAMENDVAFMREGYNNAVASYNKRSMQIPEVFLAKLFGFKEKDFLRGEKHIYQVPKIE